MTCILKPIPKDASGLSVSYKKDILDFYSTPQLKIPISTHGFQKFLFEFQTFSNQLISMEFDLDDQKPISLILSGKDECITENLLFSLELEPNPKNIFGKKQYEFSISPLFPRQTFPLKYKKKFFVDHNIKLLFQLGKIPSKSFFEQRLLGTDRFSNYISSNTLEGQKNYSSALSMNIKNDMQTSQTARLPSPGKLSGRKKSPRETTKNVQYDIHGRRRSKSQILFFPDQKFFLFIPILEN